MFTRRLCDHAFSDGKAHRRFNLTEFQRFQFRLAFSSPVEIAGNGLPRNTAIAPSISFLFHHAIDQTDFQRLFGADIFPAAMILPARCPRPAYAAFAPSRHKARHDAQFSFRQAITEVWRRQTVIGGQHVFAPTPSATAVYGGKGRYG